MSSPSPTNSVRLSPRFWVPLGVIVLAGLGLLARPLWPEVVWLCLLVALLGLFLTLQTALLRLEFSDEALVVWRSSSEIRRFPYREWISWTLFWTPLPVIFYFREQNSPHLLPVLFDASVLREQLQQRLSRLEAPPKP